MSEYENQQNFYSSPSPSYTPHTQPMEDTRKGGLGIATFILAIIGYLTGIFMIGLVFDIVAIILGIITLAGSSYKKGFAISGLSIATVSLITMIGIYVLAFYLADLSYLFM